MSEQRSARQIRAYCEALEAALSNPVGRREQSGALYVEWGINARVDMPRLLDAAEVAVKLRALFRGIRTWREKERILAETAWLAELSPEAALSADGENEEESET